MKCKCAHCIAIVFLAAAGLLYLHYDWRWNPWAARRLVWNQPTDLRLDGQNFILTSASFYRRGGGYQPLINLGVKGFMVAEPTQFQEWSAKPSCGGLTTEGEAPKSTIQTVDGTTSGTTSASAHPVCRDEEVFSPGEVFTIEKTFWIRTDYWEMVGRTGMFSLIKSTKNELFVFPFSEFRYTNRPDLRLIENANEFIRDDDIINGGAVAMKPVRSVDLQIFP